MDKMIIKGKLLSPIVTENVEGTHIKLVERNTQGQIELSPEELAKQIKDEEQLRYITANFYLYELDKMHKTQPQQEYCGCKEPNEHIERSSATGDKHYTGFCLNCGKYIKDLLLPDKPIEELEKVYLTCDKKGNDIKDDDYNYNLEEVGDKLNELIRAFNSRKEKPRKPDGS